ncbi:EAL domain-containing protein [Klebsiella pneumoniae]
MMVESFTQQVNCFTDSRKECQAVQALATPTPFESELVHAIQNGQVYPVFQPIVDIHLHIKGIEVLSRWRKDGVVLLPTEFLPNIQSEAIWFSLTAFVLQEAVQGINRYQGEFYFTVNIPTCIAHHHHLICLMETAWLQLHNPLWADCLVLEFAETVDLTQQGNTIANMRKIQERGFRIFLDDCFSQNSVIFPIRLARFCGYKLDKSIINDFQRDPHAMALMKSLIYYCQLTQSDCIAEGVGSLEKFNKLKGMGLVFFQGYLFSQPVELEHMMCMIKKSKYCFNIQ